MRTERKAAMTMTENIEMELFSSEESCAAIQTQEEQLRKPVNLHKCHKHPLVLDDEDEEDPELPVQTQTSPSPCKAQMELLTNEKLKPYSLVPGKMERTDIEMQMLPSNSKSVKASWKIAPLKWRRVLQNTGLVVKDVICLPGGYLDRQPVLRLRQRASPTVTSRITIDSDWSAVQMQNCLVLFFSRWFVQPAGQKLFFTFLQRVQGSSVLFVPETPSEGWTGGQVLQICERGPLYVLTHLDCKQVEPDKLVKKRMFCVDNATACCLDQVGQQTGEEVTLDSLLRLFRQENTDPDEKIYIRVKRDDLLHEALKVVAAPTFSFRKTPIVSFVGEETDSSEPVREFFRLVLNGLRDSCVFEGLPGRLLLTYDLAALDMRLYYKAGVLIGWSLAHRGPGPQCLHPALYQLMCRKNPSLEDFSWSQIVGTEVQSRLQQLRSCADVRSLPSSLCHWLLSCGISEICLKQSDHIPAVYSSVVKHYIFHRVASMIFQFKDGLNSCGGLWDMIESRWEMFCPVMTSVQQRPLSHQEFQQLFTVCYSQSDGPLRAAEEATVRHWEAALEKVRDGQADFSFEDLLSFITGAGRLPLFGLSTLISLRFYSQDVSESYVRLPHTSANTLELFLPRGVAAAVDLLMLLSRAVDGAPDQPSSPDELQSDLPTDHDWTPLQLRGNLLVLSQLSQCAERCVQLPTDQCTHAVPSDQGWASRAGSKPDLLSYRVRVRRGEERRGEERRGEERKGKERRGGEERRGEERRGEERRGEETMTQWGDRGLS
ncbi:hypothetical protein D4764_07G0011770, partial [Takifugu flavidus]